MKEAVINISRLTRLRMPKISRRWAGRLPARGARVAGGLGDVLSGGSRRGGRRAPLRTLRAHGWSGASREAPAGRSGDQSTGAAPAPPAVRISHRRRWRACERRLQRRIDDADRRSERGRRGVDRSVQSRRSVRLPVQGARRRRPVQRHERGGDAAGRRRSNGHRGRHRRPARDRSGRPEGTAGHGGPVPDGPSRPAGRPAGCQSAAVGEAVVGSGQPGAAAARPPDQRGEDRIQQDHPARARAGRTGDPVGGGIRPRSCESSVR